LHFLYPDETHDGAAATDAGFGYRIVYVAPELLGDPLPFVREPVQDVTPATRALAELLLDDEPGVLAAAEIADALSALAGRPAPGGALDHAALARVHEHLAAHACEATPAEELERIAGLDRFTLARQFRRAYGTSPDRYRTLRRLD